MTAVEARRIERFGDRAIGGTSHRQHLGIWVVLTFGTVHWRRVRIAPDREPFITRHRRAAREVLLLERLPSGLIHPQHPRRAVTTRSRRRKEQILTIR